MPAIITVTFNAALDKSTTIAQLVPDKKLKCTPAVCEPGGGGINVARAIKKLGGQAIAIYLAGGDTGNNIHQLLTGEMIESMMIQTEQNTRENLVVADMASGTQYLFDMPGPVVSEREWQTCLNIIRQTPDVRFIVASGSLPEGVPADIFARIAAIAHKKNAKLIVDTTGEPLKQAIQAGVYLIKPNMRELAALAGKDELDRDSAAAMARELLHSGNCQAVVVSLGSEGAILVTKEQELNIIPPVLQVESTVGAGDSMVAGIVLSLEANQTLAQAVRYGVACGSAATMHTGTELCTKANADQLAKMVRITAPETLDHSNSQLDYCL